MHLTSNVPIQEIAVYALIGIASRLESSNYKLDWPILRVDYNRLQVFIYITALLIEHTGRLTSLPKTSSPVKQKVLELSSSIPDPFFCGETE